MTPKISEAAALLNRMANEEQSLEREIAEKAKELERLLDRRDAIRCCRVALERSGK